MVPEKRKTVRESIGHPSKFGGQDSDAAAQAVSRFFEATRLNRQYAARVYGDMSPISGQKGCLLVLRAVGEESQKEIARLLGIRSTSTGELLAKLEHKGLVERHVSEEDRRVTLARLTDKGRAEADEVDRARAHAHRELVASLTPKETEELTRLLDKVCASYRGLLEELDRKEER